MRAPEDSIVRLLKQRPFYGEFQLQCRRQTLTGSAPAGVTLAINAESFALFSTDEQQALLEHLTKHLLRLHPCRRHERRPGSWDLACDLAINGSIANLPPESPLPARLRLPEHLSAEERYDRLPQIALRGKRDGAGEDEGDGPAQDQPRREAFAAELLQIARGRETRLTVLYTGSRIQKIATFSATPQTVEVYNGGGYTDLRPAFEDALQMVPPPAAVIYLTDGFGKAPNREDFPTLWVLTEEGQLPAKWGIELRLQQRETGS